MQLRSVLSALSLLLAPGLPAAAEASEWIGCPEAFRGASGLEEIPAGPLTLKRVVCHPWPSSNFPWTPKEVSPDGGHVAAYGSLVGVVAAPMAPSGALLNVPVELGPLAWGTVSPRAALKWDNDTETLWTALQDRMKPAGWATSPMRPVKATPSGELLELEPLTHPSGPLDALWWVNGRGLALAQFGTRGGYYRPERADHAPTIAFVDASKGRVLDSLPLAEVELTKGPGPTRFLIGSVATTVLPDGRPRAFVKLRRWVTWTAGEPAKVLDDPYPREPGVREAALSPDGSKLLVSLTLPTTTVCPIVPPCHRGPMVRGPIAALHDLSNGRVLWRVEGEDDWGSAPASPIISPNGRYALVGLPPRTSEPDLAVVSMRDGRILQRIRAHMSACRAQATAFRPPIADTPPR